MPLSLSRQADPTKVFESWDEYLDTWAGDTDVTFCRALAHNYDALVRTAFNEHQKLRDTFIQKHRGNPDLDVSIAEFDPELTAIRLRYGFPWVTPVIGSGCLSAAEGPEARLVEQVPAQLADAVADWGLLPDGDAKGDAARAFAQALIDSKLGAGARPPLTAATPATVDRSIAARSALCAHLLAKLYFETGALGEWPLASVTAPMRLNVGRRSSASLGAEIEARVVEPLLRELQALKESLGGLARADLAFVSTFADTVRADLSGDQPKVRGVDVSLMAEITWHFMTEGTSQYPGWSDLLVLLGFAFNSPDRKERLPHFTNLGAARERLAHELATTTTVSWESRLRPTDDVEGARPSSRDELYDAVANLLIAQAGLSSPDTAHHQASFAPAVAFVTSFDLELEMALMAKRAPFRLVMPFYVQRSAGEASGYVWLHTVIVPPKADEELVASDLDAVFRPAAWSLIVAQSSGNADLFGLPTVVRLAGSPLVQAPDLRSTTDDWATRLRQQLGHGIRVTGTVLLDEHTALQQWAADFGRPLDDDGNESRRLGLPEQYVKGMNDDRDARFWFLLGVQLNDDAIRQRTAALLASADLRSGLKQSSPPNRTRRSGVVVNRRSTATQRDVFLWEGLDVVEDSYEKVVAALNHAALHAAQPELRRIMGDPCDIGAPA